MREHDFRKYLRKNPAEIIPELKAYTHCVVIPAWQESETLPAVLDSLERAEQPVPAAIIAVVNHPQGADGADSLELLQELKARNLKNLFVIYAPDLTGGVGEARKIGMDCFVGSREFSQLENAFIYSLDGDSPVEKNYFTETAEILSENANSPGIIIKIRHSQAQTTDQEEAIREYERYMFRYAQKLQESGSPYGFVSIGSGFAVRCGSYIRSGGMKVKKAGEDFYFLQELAKQGELCQSRNILVHPSPRISERVPFGTGRSVKELLGGGKMEDIPDFAFEKLKTLLDAAKKHNGFLFQEKLPEQIPGDEIHFLQAEKFHTVWPLIVKNTPPEYNAKIKAFFRWFDGLKTLRFLHAYQRAEKK